jgi:hypothetical protein
VLRAGHAFEQARGELGVSERAAGVA